MLRRKKKIELPKEIGMVSSGNRVVRESTSEKVTFEQNLEKVKKHTMLPLRGEHFRQGQVPWAQTEKG